MTPIPEYAHQPTPLEMALLVSRQGPASLIEVETALAVLDRDGDPSDPEHRLAYSALHRRYGRAMGHRPAPAKWEAP